MPAVPSHYPSLPPTVIGLTNRPELIDGALLRPGRLEVQAEPNPNPNSNLYPNPNPNPSPNPNPNPNPNPHPNPTLTLILCVCAQGLVAEHGSDVWWEKEEAELLPPSHAAEARRTTEPTLSSPSP